MTAQPIPQRHEVVTGLCRLCDNDHGADTICPHCGYGRPCGHHYLCPTRDPRYLKRMEGVP